MKSSAPPMPALPVLQYSANCGARGYLHEQGRLRDDNASATVRLPFSPREIDEKNAHLHKASRKLRRGTRGFTRTRRAGVLRGELDWRRSENTPGAFNPRFLRHCPRNHPAVARILETANRAIRALFRLGGKKPCALDTHHRPARENIGPQWARDRRQLSFV